MGTALGCTGQALALDASWSGAVDGNFGTPGNWVGGAVPDGTASFGASPVTSLGNVALGSSFGGFSFGGTTGPYSFSGVSGNFTGGGIVNADPFVPGLDIASGGTLGFLNSASAGNAALNATAAGSSLVFGGTSSGGTAAVTLGASSTLDISSHASGISLGALNGAAGSQVVLGSNRLTLGGSGTFAGAMSGDGGLTVAAGTFVLTGANSYMGQTVIGPGATLRIGDGGTSGNLPPPVMQPCPACPGPFLYAGGEVVNNGLLVFNRADSYGHAGPVSGSGSVHVETGTVSARQLGHTGGTLIDAGATLSTNFLQGNVVNNGSLRLSYMSGGGIFLSPTYNTTVPANISGSGSVYASNADSITLSGNNSFTGGLTIAGTQVILTGQNTYSGGTFIDRGGLTVQGSMTGNIALSGEAGVAFNRAGATAFSGDISGTGTVSVPAGKLVLTGNVAVSGATFVATSPGDFLYQSRRSITNISNLPPRPGGLQIGNGGTSGSVSGNIENFGTVWFNRSDDVTYGGVIAWFGNVTQLGPGTLTLSGANTYTGATTVEAGTLSVTGSIASSSGVTVMSGATLSGTGVLPSVTVQSGGIFAPGNSVGTATVSGNLSLASGSTTAIEVQGATADRINVTGAASLAGTLKLIPLGGSYAFNTPYTLIAAQGGRSGTFSTVSTQGSFGAGVTSQVSYTPGAVNLTLTPASLTTVLGQGANGGSSASPAVPGNLAGLIAALDAARLAGRDLSAFFGAYNAPAALLGTALNQLTGEVTTASNGMGLLAGQEFMTTMLNPFREGRETVLGHRIRPDESADGDDWFGGPPQRYAMWGQATGAYSRLSGDGAAGSATRSARGAGFAMGFDMAVGTQSMVGVALAAGETSASLSGGLGSSRSWTGQLGVNGMTRVGPFTLQGAAALSFLDVESKRTLYFLGADQLRADYGARVWSTRVEARHDGLARGPLRLQPMVAVQAQVVQTDAYSERGGAAALRVEGSTNSNVRTELGFQADALGRVAGRPARGFLRAAWAHYLLREESATMSFLALPGTGFSAQGARGDRDSAVLALGGEAEIAPRWTLGARLDSELSARLREVSGTVRLRYVF